MVVPSTDGRFTLCYGRGEPRASRHSISSSGSPTGHPMSCTSRPIIHSAVDGRGWRAALELVPGDHLETASDALAEVRSRAGGRSEPAVYNFEVEGMHSYFVGEGGEWVHNACWVPGAGDADFRGKNISFKEALDKGFDLTGVPRDKFEISQWAKNKYGKSVPVEWTGPKHAEVSVDIGHAPGKGPTTPHIGYQGSGKGAPSGHILLDDVPANRTKIKE